MDFWQTDLHDDGVFVAAYNNPPTNYLTGTAFAEFGELIHRWREPDVRAVLVTSAVPDRYITHMSLDEFEARSQDRAERLRTAPDTIAAFHSTLSAIGLLDKPVVAGITGDAGGVGLELSLNCDIRIMQRGFHVGFPEAALGILTATGSQLLVRMLGRSRALDFLLRSRYVSSDGALELGIVNELADDARARGLEVARGLARQSPAAMIAVKRSIVRGGNVPIAEGLRIEAEEWVRVVTSDEAVERIKSYVATPFEKRLDWIRENGVWPEPGNATGS